MADIGLTLRQAPTCDFKRSLIPPCSLERDEVILETMAPEAGHAPARPRRILAWQYAHHNRHAVRDPASLTAAKASASPWLKPTSTLGT